MSARTKLLVAVIAATAVTRGFAQSALGPASIDPVDQLVEQIAEIRSKEGPTPVGLIDPLHDLAQLYEADGDHALAIVALEEARYVTRVHQGLSSADEALLLREQIRNEKALGQHERVWDLEQELVTIARQHYDDVRMVPVFRELAEDRSDTLERYRGGQITPEIYAGCYYVEDVRPYDDKRGEVRPPERDPSAPQTDGVGTGCRSGESSSVVTRLTAEILEYYADAIEIMLRNGDYASQELRDLEKQSFRTGQAAWELARSRYNRFSRFYPLFSPFGPICEVGSRRIRPWDLDELLALDPLGDCLGPVIHREGEPAGANPSGWVNLVRLIALEARSGAPAAARANAIAELADWLLVSTPLDRRRYVENDEGALELYGRAYRELEQDDEARASIFSPEVPVTLPASEPNPFASAATAESPRYLDVSFDITTQGRGERIEILETTQGATRAEERELIRSIESANFRPRFFDGKLADAAPVVVRYHLSDEAASPR
jgi:tetratricopeptide (TPR) repeat protein